jgi:hypothetical protein
MLKQRAISTVPGTALRESFMQSLLSTLFSRTLTVVSDGYVKAFTPDHEWIYFRSSLQEEFALSFDSFSEGELHGEYRKALIPLLFEKPEVAVLLKETNTKIIPAVSASPVEEERHLIFTHSRGTFQDFKLKGSIYFSGVLTKFEKPVPAGDDFLRFALLNLTEGIQHGTPA